MNTYTLYNSDGEITGYFCGDAETLALNVNEGILTIEGEYSHLEYKIIDGQVVAKSSEEKLPPLDEVWSELRTTRNILLSDCDWTQVADAPITTDTKIAWQTYRQTLRDLPANTTDPRNPTWPSKPS
jgi:hypothetical protein